MNKRVELFGMQIDPVTMSEAVGRVFDWVQEPGADCQFVVTPNVDHAVMYQEDAGLRDAYQDAGLVLADGLPVVLASRLLRRGIPQRVTGSDLVPQLFEATRARGPINVFLLGAGPGVAEKAAKKIQLRWPGVRVVGTYSPPLGFEKNPAENENIVAMVNNAMPDLLVVGLGAPKQELWVHQYRTRLNTKVALCVGATIDFLAGEKARAPMWMRQAGLEWCHRLATEPRRLAKRYLRDAWIFPRLVWREMLGRPSRSAV
jgi:N-acetylglucosaminyldiphosphoundecaprenol N-acetyl-beta-D-mannosaminyltransferase